MCERPNAAVYIEEAQILKVSKDVERGAAELCPWNSFRYEECQFWGRYWLAHGLIVCGYHFQIASQDLAAPQRHRRAEGGASTYT
jgi:hypothetical protein